MVDDTPKDWSEYLSIAPWAYKTTRHSTTKATPFSLVFGAEAVLLAEIAVPLARMVLGGEPEDSRLGELEALEGKSVEATERMKEYQRKLMLAYDKQVRPRMFVEEEMVMKAVDTVIRKQAMAKWAP